MNLSLRLRLVACLLGILSIGLTSGCVVVAAGAAGAGAVAWVRGELDANLGNSFDDVSRATTRALEQLQLAKISEAKSALDAEFVARTGQDKRIQIRLDRTTDNLTRVRIRVGTFGDEALSRAILDKIRANL